MRHFVVRLSPFGMRGNEARIQFGCFGDAPHDGHSMKNSVNRLTTNDSAAASPNNPGVAANLVERLNLPEEVTSQEAATILGCCKHTVLQYLEEGLLEWRNIAPPSSDRPVYRFTLRSVTELRLGYQRGSPRPPRPNKAAEKTRRSKPGSDYKPQHLRRKKPANQ